MMDTFYFSTTFRDSARGFRAYTRNTNLANWGSNRIVGNVSVCTRGAARLTAYFTPTNPQVEGLFVDSEAFQLAKATLEAMKIIKISGSESLVGMVYDWVPFTDLNYVTILVEDTTSTGLDVDVQLIEQRLPGVEA